MFVLRQVDEHCFVNGYWSVILGESNYFPNQEKKTMLKGVLNMINLAYVFKDSCDYIA